MDKVQKIREEVERIQLYTQSEVLKQVLDYIDDVQKEPVSEPQVKESAKVQHVDKMCKENGNSLTQEPIIEGLEEEVKKLWREINTGYEYSVLDSYDILYGMCLDIANWQKEQDQSAIELAEDHAYFAGRTKTIDEIKEALLSEVLPCFMHGGEADEVVAKLEEVLNKIK